VELLEVVYEGGEVLDRALAAQRSLLQTELRSRFATLDMRRLSGPERAWTTRELAKRSQVVKYLLVRGLSGVPEIARCFPRARLFLDALGRSEVPERASLAQYAFRTTRVFAYSHEMDQTLRGAGIGLVSRHSGPFFPRVRLTADPPPRPDCFRVGVPKLAGSVLEVLGALKRARRGGRVDFDIVSTEKVSEVDVVPSAMDVAEQADLIVSASVGQDRLGPDEGAILALCTGRALCTPSSSGFKNLPYSTGKYLQAEKYVLGSYADAALRYPGERAALDAWPASLELDWESVPREVLRRL